MSDIPQTLEARFQANLGVSVRSDRVAECLSRLELLDRTLKQHVDQPIIYEWPNLTNIGKLWVQKGFHMSMGQVTGEEIHPIGLRQLVLPTRQLAVSTVSLGREIREHSNTPLLLATSSLLSLHINGDLDKPFAGLIIGEQATSAFLDAVPAQQSDFIRQMLPRSDRD